MSDEMVCYCAMTRKTPLAPKALLLILLSTSGLLASEPSHATEGGVFGGPVGGTDIRQAYLPPEPGLYGAAFFVTGTAGDYVNQKGDFAPASNPAYFTSLVPGAGLLYEYPFKPLGFSIASSLQFSVGIQGQAITINNNYLHGHLTALTDSYSDFFFASRYLGLFGARPGSNKKLKYGLTIAFGLGAEIPWGEYRSPKLPSAGKNIFITIPNVALTYLTGPNLSLGGDGTEISARVFFNDLAKNPTSLVQSGNLVDVDFAVTERYGNWQVGTAGAYAQQLNSDVSATGVQVVPDGNVFSRVALGGVVAYDSPQLGGTFKLKALFPLSATNSYFTTVTALSFSRKLY